MISCTLFASLVATFQILRYWRSLFSPRAEVLEKVSRPGVARTSTASTVFILHSSDIKQHIAAIYSNVHKEVLLMVAGENGL